MALFNEILAGRFNRGLQKIFGLKGGPPVPQLGGEITPSIGMFMGVEERNLFSYNRFGVFFIQTAGAAQTSNIRMRNPANSNVVAVIESIWFKNNSGVSETFQISHGAAAGTDFTTAITPAGNRMDPRGNPNWSLVLSRQNAGVTGGTGMAQIMIPTGNSIQVINSENQEIPIFPGDLVDFDTATVVNLLLECSVIWRERPLEESELK